MTVYFDEKSSVPQSTLSNDTNYSVSEKKTLTEAFFGRGTKELKLIRYEYLDKLLDIIHRRRPLPNNPQDLLTQVLGIDLEQAQACVIENKNKRDIRAKIRLILFRFINNSSYIQPDKVIENFNNKTYKKSLKKLKD